MIETTTLSKAAGKAVNSLKTTVPQILVKMLNLKQGDKLQWNIEIRREGNIAVTLNPLRQ
ncbi:MAG: AbrB family transcriptional regulator [Promethearchaeati archaeon SRVP18_Atabeyarchaeia-1]